MAQSGMEQLSEDGSGGVVASAQGDGGVGADEQAGFMMAIAMEHAMAETEGLGYWIARGTRSELRTVENSGYTEALLARGGTLAP